MPRRVRISGTTVAHSGHLSRGVHLAANSTAATELRLLPWITWLGSGSDRQDHVTNLLLGFDVPHTFSNPFDTPAAFIGLMTPDLYIQYFRDLGQLSLDTDGMLQPADVARTMAHYATEVVLPETGADHT